MLRKAGIESVITSNVKEVAAAKKIILPGVGHFDYGMSSLKRTGLIDVLNDAVLKRKVPILGICLGVQLLTQGSDEGNEKGLGWIKGRTVEFDKNKLNQGYRIPHMGWTEVKNFEQSKLFTDMFENPRFYFVHSYHLLLDKAEDNLATARYSYDFAVGIEHENIIGVQFHPEKSHKFGLKLLANFAKYY